MNALDKFYLVVIALFTLCVTLMIATNPELTAEFLGLVSHDQATRY